jgi:tetratricopeptide (TPR) repeat protein
MTSRVKIILALFTVIIIGTLAFYIRMSSSGTVENLLEHSRESFGSPIQISVVSQEQMLIDSLIKKGDFVAANHFIDTSSTMSNSSKHDYRGLIFLAKGEYLSAISKFTDAIAIDSNHKGRNHRASAYLKAGFLDSAILDYRKIASYNFDYAKELGQVYEIQGINDSAIKYYSIFLQHYPDSLNVSKRLKTLKGD